MKINFVHAQRDRLAEALRALVPLGTLLKLPAKHFDPLGPNANPTNQND